MEREDLIDESCDIPSIKGHRLNVIDFLAALESSDPESQIIDSWGFTAEEKQIIENYIEENREDIVELMEEKTPNR